MVSVKKAGFTIIEVMLFLAISGLLFMGVIISTGGAINAQRYKDSVSSLHSFLQHQYSEVSNVINDNSSNVCALVGPDSVSRGQSSCVVLGRFITTTDGSNFTIKNVIGHERPKELGEPSIPTDDVSALLRYDIVVTSVSSTTYEVEWGANLEETTGSHKGFSMLILRSPLSGTVRTFLNDSQPPTAEADIKSLLTTGAAGQLPDALKKSVELCVNPGGLLGGSKSAVLIDANSTNESGVRTLGETDQETVLVNGSSSKCQ